MPPAKRTTKKAAKKAPAKRKAAKKAPAKRKAAKRKAPAKRKATRTEGREAQGSGEAQGYQEGREAQGSGEAQGDQEGREAQGSGEAQGDQEGREAQGSGEAQGDQEGREAQGSGEAQGDQEASVVDTTRVCNRGEAISLPPMSRPGPTAPGGLQVGEQPERLGGWSVTAGVHGPRGDAVARSVASPRPVSPSASSMPIVDRHWLRWHSSAAILVGSVSADRLEVVGLVGLEQQQRVRPMMSSAEPGEEVRITRRDDAVDGRPSGVPVIRVEAVALPRVVTEDDVRADLTDGAADDGARGLAALELAVDETREMEPAATERRARGAGLAHPGLDQPAEVVPRVPRALRAVGEHEQVQLGASAGPAASVAPQPNSMSSGCAPIGQDPCGRSEWSGHGGFATPARSDGTSTS